MKTELVEIGIQTVNLFGYTLYNLFAFFIVYAFLGWCLEVAYAAVNSGKFVNRGFLNGPVCPIYGFGVVIVIICLTPLAENLPALFIGSVLLTSLLEYLTLFPYTTLFRSSGGIIPLVLLTLKVIFV